MGVLGLLCVNRSCCVFLASIATGRQATAHGKSLGGEITLGAGNMTFGDAITRARKDKQLSQKEVAAGTLKEDGLSISAQYLNDVEHNRRNPPSEFIVRQLANTLDLDLDYLLFLAGRFPSDVLEMSGDQEGIKTAMKAFRRSLSAHSR